MSRNEVEAVRQRWAAVFDDPGLAWARSRSRRRALCVLHWAVIGAVGVAGWLEPTLAWGLTGVALLLVWFATYWLLSLSTRGVTEGPDTVLDERQRAERDHVHRRAYRVVLWMAMIGFVASWAVFEAAGVPVEGRQIGQLGVAALLLLTTLPTALLGWAPREGRDDD